MSENRELTAYKLPRSWIRLILWGIITLCHVFNAIGEILMGEQAGLSILRIVIIVLSVLVLVGEIRKRTEVDAQGLTCTPGLLPVQTLSWPQVERVTHRAGSFWKAEILTFYPVQGSPLVVPCNAELYAATAQYMNIEVE